MAIKVEEIMNRELFCLPPSESVERALGQLVTLGISAAPVIDGLGRPVGVVSLHDMVSGSRPGAMVSDVMAAPPVTVRAEDPIRVAARLIALTGLHHLIVVDGAGKASGFVSSIDVLRGLMGVPASHPASFPHLDARSGLTWTDDTTLDSEHVDVAPDGPGLLLLIHGAPDEPETIVWADAVDNVRPRLLDLIESQRPEPGLMGHWLGRGRLRFRAASVEDPARRAELAEMFRNETRARWTAPH